MTGAFIFRDEGDGCLSSKYFNSTMNTPLMEAAKIKKGTKGTDPFTGQYSTVWLEKSGSPEFGDLEITKKTSDIFSLKWSNPKQNYAGEAMIVDGLLVGWFK